MSRHGDKGPPGPYLYSVIRNCYSSATLSGKRWCLMDRARRSGMTSEVNQPRLSLLGVLVIGAALCVALAGLGSFLTSVYAANNTVHEIRGTVDTIDLGEVPPVIVVKGQYGSSEGIVVGAIIRQGATISRGKKRVGLDHIHAGDKVTLKYIKTREGLSVRSIVLHR